MSDTIDITGLTRAVNDALVLLEDLDSDAPINSRETLPSLLEQCVTLCAAPPSEPPPARLLHHFACTGGTLISRMIAAMPNTVLLSEIDPLSPLTIPKKLAPRPFAPTDLIGNARTALRPVDRQTVLKVFEAEITALTEALTIQGMHLVLRDHAHSHYCIGHDIPERPGLREMLAPVAPRRCSAVTVRNPIHSYQSLVVNNWVHFQPATLDEYARRYIAFLDAHDGLPLFRYEEFVEDPDVVSEQICTALELPFVAGNEAMLKAVVLSGDSGRHSDRISARPPREITDSLRAGIDASQNIHKLCDRLGYDIP